MSINQTISPQLREFRYGRSTFEYNLIYEDRKNLAITVKPDKSIVVIAPLNGNFEEIQAKLQKRGKWILKQINYFDKFHPIQPERQYISGETHYYLGRQYRLRIRKGEERPVKLKGKFFIAQTHKPDNQEYIKLMMKQWYADHAKLLLDRRASLNLEKILGKGFETQEIQYRYMKLRWGSYSSKGIITFNIELVKTPIDCIDYVIVHELCHLIHSNHDKSFYKLMGSILPDWEKRKERLELFGVR